MRVLMAVLFSWFVLVGEARAGGIAVLYFDNQGNPTLEPLKVGLAQMLVTDLQASGELEVIERGRLQEVLDELQLGHDGVVSEATAAKVGKLVGAEYFVMGSYFELMGTLRIDARVVEVETGRIVHAVGTNHEVASFLTMEKEIAESLRAKMTALAPTKAGSRSQDPAPAARDARVEAPKATATVAADPDAIHAAVAYSEGLIHLDQKDLPRAREAFEKAIAADPALEAAKAELARIRL